jgi:glyoxylase-like metal-dependent hydrolase (beta-lactamase superfamily II)
MTGHLSTIGPYELHAVLDGSFALDGGAMFGVVPRSLWECHLPPDGDNRIHMALRCLALVDRAGGRVALVDTGMGTQWSDKERAMYAIEQGTSDLLGSLAAIGVRPEDVSDVFASHLHFDHAGGLCRASEGGEPEPVFPRATLHVQRQNWEWANHPTPRDSGSYRAIDFGWYGAHTERLNLLEGDGEVLPGVRVEAGLGHTTGHQAIWVSDSLSTAVFAGDLVPTAAHLKPAWGMAYDLRPLECMAEKASLLERLTECGGVLVFDHDPRMAATTLRLERGRPALGDPVAIGGSPV